MDCLLAIREAATIDILLCRLRPISSGIIVTIDSLLFNDLATFVRFARDTAWYRSSYTDFVVRIVSNVRSILMFRRADWRVRHDNESPPFSMKLDLKLICEVQIWRTSAISRRTEICSSEHSLTSHRSVHMLEVLEFEECKCNVMRVTLEICYLF
jgi:hypothetical protein